MHDLQIYFQTWRPNLRLFDTLWLPRQVMLHVHHLRPPRSPRPQHPAAAGRWQHQRSRYHRQIAAGRFREVQAVAVESQTHWKPKTELDIDLNLVLSESRDLKSGGKPVGNGWFTAPGRQENVPLRT